MKNAKGSEVEFGYLVDSNLLLHLASRDLTQATYAFKQVYDHREEHDKELLRFLMLAGLIMYARPFSDSRGRDGRKHNLPAKQCVPHALRPLHDDLMNCRNQFFAHSDIMAHDGHFTYLENMALGNDISGYTKFIARFRTRQPDEFIPKIADVLLCIDATRQYIKKEKQRLEAEIESRVMSRERIKSKGRRLITLSL